MVGVWRFLGGGTGLLYSQQHQEKVAGMVYSRRILVRQQDLDWLPGTVPVEFILSCAAAG